MDDVIKRWSQRERSEFLNTFFASLERKFSTFSNRLNVHRFRETSDGITPFAVYIDASLIVGSYDLYFSQVGAPRIDNGVTTIMKFGGGYFERVINAEFPSPALAAEKLASIFSFVMGMRAINILSKKIEVRQDISWAEVGF